MDYIETFGARNKMKHAYLQEESEHKTSHFESSPEYMHFFFFESSLLSVVSLLMKFFICGGEGWGVSLFKLCWHPKFNKVFFRIH